MEVGVTKRHFKRFTLDRKDIELNLLNTDIGELKEWIESVLERSFDVENNEFMKLLRTGELLLNLINEFVDNKNNLTYVHVEKIENIENTGSIGEILASNALKINKNFQTLNYSFSQLGLEYNEALQYYLDDEKEYKHALPYLQSLCFALSEKKPLAPLPVTSTPLKLDTKHETPIKSALRTVKPSPSKLAGMKISSMLVTPTRSAMNFLNTEDTVVTDASSSDTLLNTCMQMHTSYPSIAIESYKSPSAAYLSSSLAGYGASAIKRKLAEDEPDLTVAQLLVSGNLNAATIASITEYDEKNRTKLHNLTFLLKDREKELDSFREKFYDIQSELKLRDRVLVDKNRELSEKERRVLENAQLEQSLRETVSNLQASIDLHEFQVNMLRTQLIEQQSRVKSVESQLSLKETTLSAEGDKKAKIKADLDAKLSECINLESTINALNFKNSALVLEVSGLNERINALMEEKKKWNAMLSAHALTLVKTTFAEPIAALAIEKKQLQLDSAAFKSEMNEIMSHVKPAIDQIVASNNSLVKSFNKERDIRKKLQNEIIELKGNIRVFCRVRPAMREINTCVETLSDGMEERLFIKASDAKTNDFSFDRVFGPNSTQESVFADVQPFMQSVIDGYNVCIFAYGQTGSGKTYTMEGAPSNPGVNYRALTDIFRHVSERRSIYKFEIKISVVEIYNEEPKDLLNQNRNAPKLEIRTNDNIPYIPDLTSMDVTSADEVLDILRTQAYPNRSVSATNMNDVSSRSHCILFVNVQSEHLTNGDITNSKLVLIDLAGSERIGRTDAQGQRLKEAQFINKSLSALGDVIASLKTHAAHIPFRNSKLTFLLQDCLSDNSKSLMFCNVSPEEADQGESLCSLKFAERVRAVTLGPTQKVNNMAIVEAQKLKTTVNKIKDELTASNKHNADLNFQLQKVKDSVSNIETVSKQKTIDAANAQNKLSERDREYREIYSQLTLAKMEIERLAKQNQQLTLAACNNISRPITPSKSGQISRAATPSKTHRAASPIRTTSRAVSPVRPTTPTRATYPTPVKSIPLSKSSTPSKAIHFSRPVTPVNKTPTKTFSTHTSTPKFARPALSVSMIVPRNEPLTRSQKRKSQELEEEQNENFNSENVDTGNKFTFASVIDIKKRVRFNSQIATNLVANGNNSNPTSPKKVTGIIKATFDLPSVKNVPAFNSSLTLKPKEKRVILSNNSALGAPSKVVKSTWRG